MVGHNAVRVYGLDGDALVRVAASINAPTTAELQEPVSEIPAGAGMWPFRQRAAFA